MHRKPNFISFISMSGINLDAKRLRAQEVRKLLQDFQHIYLKDENPRVRGEKASINVLQTLSKTITHHSVILIPDLFGRETRSNELSGSRLNKQEKKLDGQCTGASCNLSHKALFLDKTNTGTWNFFQLALANSWYFQAKHASLFILTRAQRHESILFYCAKNRKQRWKALLGVGLSF